MTECLEMDYAVFITFLIVSLPLIIFCIALTRIITPRRSMTRPAATDSTTTHLADCLCCGLCSGSDRNAVALKPGFVVSIVVQSLFYFWRRHQARANGPDAPAPRHSCSCLRCCGSCSCLRCCGSYSCCRCCRCCRLSAADWATLRIARARLLSTSIMPCRSRLIAQRLLTELERFIAEVQDELERSNDDVWGDPLFRAILMEVGEALRSELQQGDSSQFDVLNLSVDIVHRVLALPGLPKSASKLSFIALEWPRWLSSALAGSAEDVLGAVLSRLRTEFWRDRNSRLASVLRVVVTDLIAFRMLRQVKSWPVILLVANFLQYLLISFLGVVLCALLFKDEGDLGFEIAVHTWSITLLAIFLVAQLIVPGLLLMRMNRQLFLTLHCHWRRTLMGLLDRSIVADLLVDIIDVAVDETAKKVGFLLGEPLRVAVAAFGGSAEVLRRQREEWPTMIWDVFESMVPGVPEPVGWVGTAASGAHDGLHKIHVAGGASKQKRAELAVAAERFYAAASDIGRMRLALRRWMVSAGHRKFVKRGVVARAGRALSSKGSLRSVHTRGSSLPASRPTRGGSRDLQPSSTSKCPSSTCKCPSSSTSKCPSSTSKCPSSTRKCPSSTSKCPSSTSKCHSTPTSCASTDARNVGRPTNSSKHGGASRDAV